MDRAPMGQSPYGKNSGSLNIKAPASAAHAASAAKLADQVGNKDPHAQIAASEGGISISCLPLLIPGASAFKASYQALILLVPRL